MLMATITLQSTHAFAQKKKEDASAERDHPFKAGKKTGSVGGSLQAGFGNTYFVVNAAFGIFVVDGLETSLQGAYWIGSPPAVGQLSPGVTYTLFQIPSFHPYVGGFYRRWFIGSNLPDTDAVGGRGGISYRQNGSILSAGLMYEKTLSGCSEDCERIIPELRFSLSF